MQKIICEAGFAWRLVMARLEQRVNEHLDAGWTIKDKDCYIGFFGRCQIVVTLQQVARASIGFTQKAGPPQGGS